MSAEEVSFKDVRERFPVEAFFENVMGQAPRVFHTGVRFRECPNCGKSDDPTSLRVVIQTKNGVSKWRCYACDKSGDVLDAAALHYSCSVRDAAANLMGTPGLPSTVKNWKLKGRKLLSQAPVRDDAAIRDVIKRLVAANMPVTNLVKEYLNGRGFSDALIHEAQRRGMLIVLPTSPNKAKEALYDICGTDLLVKAGMLREKSRAPACAFRNFAFITHNARAIEFRLARALRENETKWISYGPMSPFFWSGEDPNSYMVTEGMSDLLSAVAMGTKASIIGLPGCRRWDPYWFSRMKGKAVTLALDGDVSGINAVNGKADAQEIAAIEDEALRLRAKGLKGTFEHFQANVKAFEFPPDFLAVTQESEKDLNGLWKWMLRAKGLLPA